MRFYIKTYGCQMNERDSEALAAALLQAGHSQSETESDADAIILNTCSVRDAAERKAKGKLGYLRKWKNARPGAVLAVAGCMAQRLGASLLKELPHLDLVLGTGELHRAVAALEEARQKKIRQVFASEPAGLPPGLDLHLPVTGGMTSQIAITRGCNRFCSYCIVPYVRGREESRPASEILDEARRLVAAGAREILLLGQNVAAYGLGGKLTPPEPDFSPFADLLEELDEIPGLERIRFTSPYPTYFNDRLIRTLASARHVCHCYHLPLQSGSDRILRAMNRQYDSAGYLKIVDRIKTAIPDVTLSTDVIVGYPGEEDSDFEQTRQVMNQVGFELAYIFKYSPRPGAKSALLADSVPEEVKEERNQILLADLAIRSRRYLEGLNGQVVEVLVEGVSHRNADRWSGRTAGNAVVHFVPDATVKPGTLRKVRIEQINQVSAVGTLCP